MNEIQKVILDIYKEVAPVCDALGIRHFAIGGTALGAVRHKGFIPWDDDLDIAMPIEDYTCFIQEAGKYLPEHLEIRTFEDVEHNQNVFSKVVDKRTTNIEPVEYGYPDAYKGIFIDIMPMSGVPSGLAGRIFTGKIVGMAAVVYGLPWKLNDRTSAKHKRFWLLSRPFKPFTDSKGILRRWDRLLAKHPFDDAEYVGYTWWSKAYSLVFPKAWFEDTEMMLFEDTVIRVPVECRQYLAAQFGDYMQLPPEGKRFVHGGFIDLEHSYTEYRDGLRKVPVRNA